MRAAVLLIVPMLLLTSLDAHADACDRAGDEAGRALCRAEELVAGKSDRGSFKQAAELLLKSWREHGQSACGSQAPSCAGYAAVLRSAASAYERSGSVAKAIAVRRLLVSPRHGLDKSPDAVLAVFELARAYERLSIFDIAADWYERFAREYPKSPEAGRALGKALRLRLSLQQHEQALQNHQLITRLFGKRDPAGVLASALLVATADGRAKRWQAVVKVLTPAMPLARRGGSGDELRTTELLARAHGALSSNAALDQEATKLDGQVLALWSKLTAAERRALKRQEVDAVAGSMLRRAQRASFLPSAMALPPLTGQPTIAAIDSYLTSKPLMVDWLPSKQQNLQAAATSFGEVISLRPNPHPRFQVAAAAERAALWHDAADGILAGFGPLPKGIHDHYQTAARSLAAPFVARARAAYEECLTLSRQLGYFDEQSRRCERWLVRHYPQDHRLFTALWRRPRPAPLRVRVPATMLSPSGEPLQR